MTQRAFAILPEEASEVPTARSVEAQIKAHFEASGPKEQEEILRLAEALGYAPVVHARPDRPGRSVTLMPKDAPPDQTIAQMARAADTLPIERGESWGDYLVRIGKETLIGVGVGTMVGLAVGYALNHVIPGSEAIAQGLGTHDVTSTPAVTLGPEEMKCPLCVKEAYAEATKNTTTQTVGNISAESAANAVRWLATGVGATVGGTVGALHALTEPADTRGR